MNKFIDKQEEIIKNAKIVDVVTYTHTDEDSKGIKLGKEKLVIIFQSGEDALKYSVDVNVFLDIIKNCKEKWNL